MARGGRRACSHPLRWSEECEASSAQIEHRSRSMHSLVESPLAEQSPTHSPMQLASRSCTDSPSHSPLELRSPSLVPAGTPPHTTHQHTTQPSNATLSSGLCSPVFTAHPGVIPDTDGMAPVDFFRLMFDGDVLNLIFTETNRYASQYLQREREHLESHPKARAHDWKKK